MTEEGGALKAAPSGASRRLRIILILSLALNLLIVGALVGSKFLGGRHGHGRGARGIDFGLMSFSRSLPKERRAEIRKTLKVERAKLRPMRRAIEDARQEAADVLVSDPLQLDALRSAVEKIAEAERSYKDAGVAIFLNTIPQLTAEERQALGERWRKKRKRSSEKVSDKKDEKSAAGN